MSGTFRVLPSVLVKTDQNPLTHILFSGFKLYSEKKALIPRFLETMLEALVFHDSLLPLACNFGALGAEFSANCIYLHLASRCIDGPREVIST